MRGFRLWRGDLTVSESSDARDPLDDTTWGLVSGVKGHLITIY